MIDSREVRRAIDFYNRASSGQGSDSDIDFEPIQLLEAKIEELFVTVRDVSELLDEIEAIWLKGNVGAVVNAATTPESFPVSSNYPKSWWSTVIIPQVQALRTHFNTKVASGKSPNEIFFARPPKRAPVVIPDEVP